MVAFHAFQPLGGWISYPCADATDVDCEPMHEMCGKCVPTESGDGGR